MATQTYQLAADTIYNIKQIPLTSGVSYLLQNRGTSPIQLFEQANAPSTTDIGLLIKPEDVWTITIGTLNVYVSMTSSFYGNGLLVITEA